MARVESVPTPAGDVTVVFTERVDGDFAVGGPQGELQARRATIVDRPWTWLRQVHGSHLVEVGAAGERAGSRADGAMTGVPGCPLAVMTADCAPVVMVSESGFAVVHAGWRGIMAGIVGRAAARLTALGGRPLATLVGPCINAAAYEFGPPELDAAVSRFGERVRGETAWGSPALDVPAAVAVACEEAGWPSPVAVPPCTSDERWFSHRTRGEHGRQATVAWLEPSSTEAGEA